MTIFIIKLNFPTLNSILASLQIEQMFMKVCSVSDWERVCGAMPSIAPRGSYVTPSTPRSTNSTDVSPFQPCKSLEVANIR